jgi:hypothetical protein
VRLARIRSGRSAAWLARLVRDQEVEGSNPFAPTTSFRIRDLLHTKNPERAWLETKHSCLMPVGRKRSLFFEFIALQRKVRFTDDPFFEKVGTGSGFWKKNQKARSKSCVLPRCHSATAFIVSNHPFDKSDDGPTGIGIGFDHKDITFPSCRGNNGYAVFFKRRAQPLNILLGALN